MNRVYKVIWNKVKGQYVVVSELAHRCTKSAGHTAGRRAAAIAAACLCFGWGSAWAADVPQQEDPYMAVFYDAGSNGDGARDGYTLKARENSVPEADVALQTYTMAGQKTSSFRDKDGEWVDEEKGNLVNGISYMKSTEGQKGNDSFVTVQSLDGELANFPEFNLITGSTVRGNLSKEALTETESKGELDTLTINGQTYTLREYAAGKGINIEGSDGKYTVSVNAGDGLAFTDENLPEGETQKLVVKAAPGDNIVVSSDGVDLNQKEVHIGGIEIAGNRDGDGNPNDNTIQGLSNTTWNKTTMDSVSASLEVGGIEASKAATQGQLLGAVTMAANADRYLHNGTEKIGTDDTGKDILGYKVNMDGTVTMTVASDDGKYTDSVVIGNIASKTELDKLDDLAVKYDGPDHTSVTLGSHDNKYDTENHTGGTTITNVAYSDGTGSDAVNVDYLKDYVKDNGGGAWNLTTNGDTAKVVSIGNGATVDFSGVTKTIGEGEDETTQSNIVVNKTTENGTTKVAFDLAKDLNVTTITATNQYVTSVNEEDDNSVTNIAYVTGHERHIATSGDVNPDDGKQFSGEYYVNSADGTISLIEVDGNGKPTSNTLVLKDIASATDLKNLDEGAVKYWRNEDGTYNKSYVELAGGENGTVINHVADGAVNENSKEAINGSQLWKVQEVAGKHTTMTVNDGMAAPEDGSYTTDGNLQLKQTNTDGQIEYDVKLNDDIVLGTETGNNVSISGTEGSVSVTTGENTIQIGGGVITGLTNTTWNGTTTTPDRAATEGQLAVLDEGAVKYWRNEDGTYDKSYVELAGGENGTVINHVADGAVNEYSKEAVNGSQLWEVQQEAKAQHTTMTVNGGTAAPADETYTDGNLQLQQTTGANGQIQYDVKLNDTLLLGGQNENNIIIDGTKGSILLNSRVDGEGVHSINIDAASGTITGLTGALTNENWTAFMNGEGGIDDTQAATESDLRLVAQHSVQYYTDEKGVIDYNRIVLGGTAYSNKSGGTMITNVAYAETDRKSAEYDGSAAVNVDVLNDAVDKVTTTVTDNEKHIATNVGDTAEMPNADYSVGADGKVTLTEVDGNGNPTGNKVVISDVASKTELDNVKEDVSDLQEDVGDLNYVDTESGKGNVVTNGDSVTEAIGDLDAAIGDLSGQITEVGENHTEVTQGNGIIVTDKGQKDDDGKISKHEYEVSLSNDITLGNQDKNVHLDGNNGNISATGSISAGNIIVNGAKEDGTASGTISGLSNTAWDWTKYEKGEYEGSSNAATEGQLHGALEGTVQYDKVTDDKGNVTIDKTNITFNKGGDSVTLQNVAKGDINENSTQAVNGAQLFETNQAVEMNRNSINMLSNSVNKLDNRIDRVGAGAAALAALHPLDFDPDAKWDFAAGYGNYRGASAVAMGAYYRPNEDVMLSVGGSMGGGENMVNAGVSIKLGAGSSHVSTSRVAMAKEIESLRGTVAQLTALVNTMVGSQHRIQNELSTEFPDVPENHWAYEAVETLAKSGLAVGYPDGQFKGDRSLTRYEFAEIVHRALQAGVGVDARLVEEFEPELEFFRIDTITTDADGNPVIQRVRVNK